MDQIEGHERYALEFGPILLAIVGTADARLRTSGTSAQGLTSQLRTFPGPPLHFAIDGDSDHRYMPYYAIKEESHRQLPVPRTLASEHPSMSRRRRCPHHS